jgi:superfamily II DNA/RNA helicase
MNDFSGLGVRPCFVTKLEERNIREATDIQLRVIPLLASGGNVFFRSATGTGKTFAYLLPLLGRLLPDQASPELPEQHLPEAGLPPGAGIDNAAKPAAERGLWPRLLIMAPTYELCSQIKAEADFLLSGVLSKSRSGHPRLRAAHDENALSAALVIGSVNLSRQIESLKKEKPALIVGNPGRLLVLSKMGKLKFRGLDYLVMDEADRLVSDEMLAETSELCGIIGRDLESAESAAISVNHCEKPKIPAASVLTFAACSATLPEKTRERLLSLPLFQKDSGEAPFIETGEHEILRQRIEHWAIFAESRRKISTLRSLLAAVRPKKALVFSARTEQAAKIAAALAHHKVNAGGLYRGMETIKRKEAIDAFRSGKISVLVSSDLAARGLDIPDISHIIALDVPVEKDAYIHRAGRSGRAGKRGIMVSIGDEVEMRRLAALEKKLQIIVRPRELYGGKVCVPSIE